MSIFSFPGEPRWDEETEAVLFEVEVGEYHGIVQVPRRVFRAITGGKATGEDCVTHFHLGREGFERIAEAKIRARDLTPDGNLLITQRDVVRFGRRSE
jgi:hypothetical protein